MGTGAEVNVQMQGRPVMNRGFTVHYAPGDGPLCGSDYPEEALTDNPDDVTGCEPCLELVAEDLADDNEYGGHCLHCRREITARTGVAQQRGQDKEVNRQE